MHSFDILPWIYRNKPSPKGTTWLAALKIFRIQNNPLKIMDQMDIDPIVDVPDTPDRLILQNKKRNSSLENGSNLSMSGPSEHCNQFDNKARNGHKPNDKGSRKLLIHAPRSVVGSGTSDCNSNLAFASEKSSLSNNSVNFRRRLANEFSSYEKNHFQPIGNDGLLYTQTSARKDGSVDLTDKNGVEANKKVHPCEALGSSRAEGHGKRLLSTNRLPSSHRVPNSSWTSRCTNKGKEPNGTFLALDSGNAIESFTQTQSKTGKVVSTSPNSVSIPRVTGQKRLVRNGCISPHNIEMAKQVVGNEKNGVIDSGLNCSLPLSSGGVQTGSDEREAVAEGHDSRTLKGKGIMPHPSSVKQPDIQSTHNRDTVSIDEIVEEAGNGNEDTLRGFEELGGWRSTRNRSKKMNLPSSDEHQHLHRERIGSCLDSQLPGMGATRGKIASAAGIRETNPMDQDSTSILSASRPLPTRRVPNIRSKDQFNGHHAATSMLTKRKKQGSSSTSQGECSGATLDDSVNVFLGSPRDTSELRSNQTRSRNGLCILEPVIEIDEASPEVGVSGSSSGGCNSNAEDAKARQIEADEILARELQEQFYNEVPSVGVSEIDGHVALALQHEENSPRAFSRQSQHVFSHGNSSMANSNRQSQSRSPLLSRRGPQARGPTFNRMARLRSRFPGRPRTISSSGERNSLFPADMDVDMRMHILEALEAFSDMGVDNNLLQIQREFNENDYEMLLSLDENNDQHGGASTSQINSLPQSTVQSDNIEEACAICLETPTMGDGIRHLPCLHKFHKDCIDPWLRRRKSCPVCKSSIT